MTHLVMMGTSAIIIWVYTLLFVDVSESTASGYHAAMTVWYFILQTTNTPFKTIPCMTLSGAVVVGHILNVDAYWRYGFFPICFISIFSQLFPLR
jgi:hypothetical protein